MNARLETDDLDGWSPPPLDRETEAKLEAMGVKRPTRRFDPNWHPVRKRPRWLAFLIRVLRIDRDRQEEGDIGEESAMNAPARDEENAGWKLPLHEDEIAALKAMGARFARGGTLPPYKPVKKRPVWLAFLLRTIGRA